MSASNVNSYGLHSPDWLRSKGVVPINETLDQLVEKINESIRLNFFVRGYLKTDLSSFDKEKLVIWIDSNQKFQHLDPNQQMHFSVPFAVDILFEQLKEQIRSYFQEELNREAVVSLMNEKSKLIDSGKEDYSWLRCNAPLSEDLKKALMSLLNHPKLQILDSEVLQHKMDVLFKQIEKNGQTEVISAGLESIFGLERDSETEDIAYRLEKGNPFKRSLVELLLDNPGDAIGLSFCFFEHDKIRAMKVEKVNTTKHSHMVLLSTIEGSHQEVQIQIESKLIKKIIWTTRVEGTLKSFLSRLDLSNSNSEVCTIGVLPQHAFDWHDWLPAGEYRVELLSDGKEDGPEYFIAEPSEGEKSALQQLGNSELESGALLVKIPHEDAPDSSKSSASEAVSGGFLIPLAVGFKDSLKSIGNKILSPLRQRKYIKELRFTPTLTSDVKPSGPISIKLYLDNASNATYFTICRENVSKDFSVDFQWFSHCFPVRFKEIMDADIDPQEQHKIYFSQTEPLANEKFAEKIKSRSIAEKKVIDALKKINLDPFFSYLINHWSDPDLFKEQGGTFNEVRKILSLQALKEPMRALCGIEEIHPGSYEGGQLLLRLILRANLEQLNRDPDLNLSDNTNLIQMLGTSLERSNDLKEKRGIALLGETGAGKSTTACFLIGAEMEEYQNRFGDSCIQIDKAWKSKQPESRLPEVGLALGISQTTFVESFDLISTTKSTSGRADLRTEEVRFPEDINKNSFAILDFPGFRDTRGTDYEVTTSFSLDHAILSLKRLDAIAQVIPYNLLVASRGIYFISTLIELSRRFKGCIFNPVFSSKIFFFITKQPSGIDVANITERALQLINEEANSPSSNLIKCQVLQFFINQCQKGNVFRILPKARLQRIDILNKVLETVNSKNQGGDLKEQYDLALDGPEMKKIFMDVVNDSITVWMSTIFPSFLEKSKDDIKEKDKELVKIELQQKNFEECIADKKEDILMLEKEAVRLNEMLRELKESPKSATLPVEWLKELEKNEKTRYEQIQQKEIQLKVEKTTLSVEISELKNNLEAEKRKEEELKVAIHKLDTDIKDKTTGVYPQELHNRTFKEEELIPVNVYHEDVDLSAKRRRAIDRGADRVSDRPEEYESKERSVHDKFNLSCIADIDRDYQLLPPNQDQTNAAALNELISGKNNIVLDYGNYTIKIESNKVRFDYIRHHNDGRQVCYGYIAAFDGMPPYPSLKITHVIPKAELYRSEVNRCKQEKAMLEGKRMACSTKIGKLVFEIEEKEKDLKSKNHELEKLTVELDAEKKQVHEKTVSSISDRLAELIKEKQELCLQVKAKELEIRSLEPVINTCKSELDKLHFTRKRWALFIRTHESHLKNAIKMAGFITSLKPKKTGSEAIDEIEASVVAACLNFSNYYEKEVAHLEQELKDLGLEPREKLI